MKTLTRMAIIAALAAAFFAVAPTAGAQESARIHLLHGIPDTPVDVLVDGEPVFEDFQPGATQDLSALAGETLTQLQVNVAGTDTVAIAPADVTLPSSGNYTVVAHLTEGGDPTLAVFENDTSEIASGEGRLVVRHTAAAPAVDVLAGGAPVIEGLSNPDERSLDLPVGTIEAAVAAAGTTDPVIGPLPVEIEDGTSLIVYAVGALGEDLTVYTETITGLGAAPAQPEAQPEVMDETQTPVPSAVNTGNSPVEDAGTAFPYALVAAVALAVAAFPVGRLVVARVR